MEPLNSMDLDIDLEAMPDLDITSPSIREFISAEIRKAALMQEAVERNVQMQNLLRQKTQI